MESRSYARNIKEALEGVGRGSVGGVGRGTGMFTGGTDTWTGIGVGWATAGPKAVRPAR